MKKYNIVTGTIFLLIAIGAYEIGTSFVAKLPTDPLGPAWWPECLSIALGIFSILLILQGVLTPQKQGQARPHPFQIRRFSPCCKAQRCFDHICRHHLFSWDLHWAFADGAYGYVSVGGAQKANPGRFLRQYLSVCIHDIQAAADGASAHRATI